MDLIAGALGNMVAVNFCAGMCSGKMKINMKEAAFTSSFMSSGALITDVIVVGKEDFIDFDRREGNNNELNFGEGL